MLSGAPHAVDALEGRLDPRLRQIVDGLAEGFLGLGADWGITDCNDVAERLLDRKRESLVGRRYCDLSGLAPDSPFAVLIQNVAAARTPEAAEIEFRSGKRSRLLSVRAFPLGDGIAVVWTDITLARVAERRLALSEARYRELADGTPAASWMSRADGTLEFINQAMVEAFGRPRRELLGRGWMKSIHPEDREAMMAARAKARANHSSLHYEGRVLRPDQTVRIIELYGRPRFDALGGFRGHVGIASDVTDAREADRRRSLLVNELNHRVKNTLATVQSLVRHTLRDYGVPQEAERALNKRLIALATAHNVLNRENWQGADLDEVVQDLTRPYQAPGRIWTTGPKVRVSPRTAIALAMALQELATNAAKHGALASPTGRVELTWTRNEDSAELVWREIGDRPIAEPGVSGFGSQLLGRMLEGELGRAADINYTPEGLICRIYAPVAA
jgi:PAS domain S-box-containing protein